MAAEMGKDPDHDLATRTGELAMLIYSISEFSVPFHISMLSSDTPS